MGGCQDHVDLFSHELRCECGQPLRLVASEHALVGDILAFDIAMAPHALREGVEQRLRCPRRAWYENADRRHLPRGLRVGGE
jgi:hypothetical protein